MLTNILKSIANNFDNRLKNPIIGSFITSWIICNWNHLVLLIWGSGDLEQRIQSFNSAMQGNYISTIVAPSIVTLLYLFALPTLNLLVQKGTKFIDLSRHASIVNVNLEKQRQLGELNKEKFKANPENGFIKKELELEFDKSILRKKILEQEELEKREQAQIAELDRTKAERSLDVVENQRKISELELDKSFRNNKREQEKRELEVARHQVMMKATQLPVVLELLNSLSINLWKDKYKVSFQKLIKIICDIFGYNTQEELLSDENFNSETLMEIKYLTYNPLSIATVVDDIEGLESNDILEYIEKSLNLYEISFTAEELLPDKIREDIQINHSILLADELSDTIAETNCYFEDEPDLDIESYGFSKDQKIFEITLVGQCHGTVHEDRMISGNLIGVSVIASIPVILGKYGLSTYELEISSAVIDQNLQEDFH